MVFLLKLFWIDIIFWLLLLLLTVAFFTLGERKFMGSIQRRKGPDVVGFWGLLQPAADGVKLVFKELIFPLKSSTLLFYLAPVFVFTLSLTSWAVIPLSTFSFITSIHLAILYTLITGGLNIYGIIIAGWSSNSRYAFLGGVRATAQMISYELVLGTVNLFIAFYAGSYNYFDIVFAQQNIWFCIPLFPVFIMYLIVMLAETNRTPFDLAEAEAELVAGYNIEYSSIMFAMFFLGEYSNMILLSVICVLYFFGGWMGFSFFPILFFIFKVLFFCMFFVWVRATLPRYRYDQLMEYGWKHLLPFCFGLFIFLVSFCLIFDFRVDIDDLITNQNLLFYIYNLQQTTSFSFINDNGLTNLFLDQESAIFMAEETLKHAFLKDTFFWYTDKLSAGNTVYLYAHIFFKEPDMLRFFPFTKDIIQGLQDGIWFHKIIMDQVLLDHFVGYTTKDIIRLCNFLHYMRLVLRFFTPYNLFQPEGVLNPEIMNFHFIDGV